MFSLIPVACESHDSPKMVKVNLYAHVIQTNKKLQKNKKKIKINDNDDRLFPLFSSFTLHLSAWLAGVFKWKPPHDTAALRCVQSLVPNSLHGRVRW